MNDTLTHELIHAYDYCRAELDWNNLGHLACTEVSVMTAGIMAHPPWGNTICFSVDGTDQSSQSEWRLLFLEGEFCQAQVWMEETSPSERPENLISVITLSNVSCCIFLFVQVCVKERAIRSILCVQDVTQEEARQAVEKVFDSCFKDTVPFERVPP